MPARIAIIAITTSSSINVNALRSEERVWLRIGVMGLIRLYRLQPSASTREITSVVLQTKPEKCVRAKPEKLFWQVGKDDDRFRVDFWVVLKNGVMAGGVGAKDEPGAG